MELARAAERELSLRTELPDGTPVWVRPIVPADSAALAEGFAQLSLESRSRRFLTAVPALSPRTLRYLTEVDYINHFALVVWTSEEPEQLIAVGRYIRLTERPEAAEMAATVGDAYQGRGVGTLLMQSLIAVAQAAGISTFVASVRQDNAAMRALLSGARSHPEGSGVLGYELDLTARGRELAGRPMYRRYRSAAEAVVAACTQRAARAG